MNALGHPACVRAREEMAPRLSTEMAGLTIQPGRSAPHRAILDAVKLAGRGMVPGRRPDPTHPGGLVSLFRSLSLITLTATLAAPLDAQELDYPRTRTVDVVEDYHGTPVADPYRWLEDTDARETLRWVQAQNRVTFGYLESLSMRHELEARLTELWDYEKYGAPFRDGGAYWFFKNDGLQNQSVLYRQQTPDADPVPVLDPNTFSDDGTVALTALDISDDGRYLAYGTSSGGSDWQAFHVRDLATGEDLPDHIRWVKFSGMSWTEDGAGFFYARYDEPEEGEAMLAANRNQKLYYHRVGTDQSEDVLVYARPDEPDWGFGAEVTEDGRYLLINVWKGTDERNRLYYIDLEDPEDPAVDGAVVKLLDAFDASYGVIANEGPVLYVLTNLDAPRRRIVAIDLRDPERERWREVVPESPHVIRGAALIGGKLVVSYLEDAKSVVRFFDRMGRPWGVLPTPGIGTVGSITGEVDDSEMFYTFTSFLYPSTVFRYDLDTGENQVFRAPDVDFDPSRYETRQVFYTSKDGTRVPMFVTHRRGLELDGANPTYLYAYGGFNISMTPGFSVTNLVWLEQGGVYAMPNLRGGGEYGEEWHQAGTKERKQNVFDDFIAAAEYLIDEGYTSPERLAIGGGSNGGLLVGAVITQRPDLYAVAHPAVGVMDMLRFHEFTIGWAWVSDYGSADDPEMFPHLYAYSPYHNIQDGTCYPATLVTTADHDDRVVPGHSFKFAARLQAAQSCDHPALIRIETRAGHGAGTPTTKRIEQAADILAFRMANLGMAAPGTR